MSEASANNDLMERGLAGETHGSRHAEEAFNVEDPASPTTSVTLAESQIQKEGEDIADVLDWDILGIRKHWKEKQAIAKVLKEQETSTILPSIRDYRDGYARLASIIDSDERFLVFRRFGILQTRLVLYKQDELRCLELELQSLDENEMDETFLSSRGRDDLMSSGERKALMFTIDKKYKEYGELLLLCRDIANLESPIQRNYLDLKKYFDICKPLCLEETYIRHRGDVITLMPNRDITWLDNLVEKIFDKFQNRVMRWLFAAKGKVSTKGDPDNGIVLYSRRRFETVVTLIILCLISALLIMPVYVVWKLTRGNTSISVIITVLLVFTLVFSIVLLKFTRARRHETLAGAAAYCAVLVTFLGNSGQLTPSTDTSILAQNMTSASVFPGP